jgi:hypothetical protein
MGRRRVVNNGHIKRLTDPDIQSSVLEVMGTNVSTTFITAPSDAKDTLAIKLPYLVMILKNVCLVLEIPNVNVVEEVLLFRGTGSG